MTWSLQEMAWCGIVQYSMMRLGMVWCDADWYYMVRCGVVWCNVVSDTVRCNAAWNDDACVCAFSMTGT